MTHYPIHRVYAGRDLGDTIWLCRKGEGFLCGNSRTHLEKLIKDFQNYVISHPEHVHRIKEEYIKRAEELRCFINKSLSRFDYSKADNKTLVKDYKIVASAYRNVYTYSEPLAIAIGDLSDRLRPSYLALGVSNAEFEILILPTKPSFIQKEQQDFLAIALSNKGREILPATIKKIALHTHKYKWLPYDYGVTSYDFEYFKDQLSRVLKKDKKDIRKKYKDVSSYEQNLKNEQTRISRKHSLGEREMKLIGIIRTAFFLVDSKKELFTRFHYEAERLFSAISERVKLPGHLLRYSLPEEVLGFLRGNKINQIRLQERYDGCVIIVGKEGSVKIRQNQAAKKTIHNFIKNRHSSSASVDILGRCANQGIVRGKVKVILDARMCDTFKHGEILVTAMTSPDYMPAARRAAAIITDEGSVTCHAAIISRELGIPCIVGTRVATQTLKDGDVVDLDALNGRVKIIQAS